MKDANTARLPGDDRAQPGDVLGIERDGARTELGDTKADETERLDEAEDEGREAEQDRRERQREERRS